MSQTAEQLLEKAGAQLLFTQPFWATIGYQLERGRVAVGPEVCPVAATDGKALFYNREGITGLKTFGQVKTVLAHENAHLAMGDHVWMIGKDPELANQAADHVNNHILLEGGFEPVDGWLCDPRFKGQTKDAVYATLQRERQQKPPGGGKQPPPPPQQKQKPGGQQQQQQQQPQPQPGPGSGPGNTPKPGAGNGAAGPPQAAKTPGGFGQIMPCPPAERAKEEQKWKMAVETAATAAKAAGKLPGYLQRIVEEIRESKVPWADLLRAFLANQIPTDFTWARPSKRTLSQGIYLPSQKKEGLGELVFSIDASGSISKKALASFLGEVNTVAQDLKPSKIWLVSHDTVCHELGEFGPGDEITVEKVKGGGGTDFRCVFDWVSDNGIQPRAIVFLTDLYGTFPKHEPDVPVLWACTSRQIAPFGETARMEGL